jgi:hypothetical protein
MATKGAKKTLNVQANIWWDSRPGSITIKVWPEGSHATGGIISTVNSDPKNVRGNPNLYNKLGKLLKNAGFEEP